MDIKLGEPVNCSASELCIFLQVLAEGYLPTYSSDTSQFARSKSMHIVSKSYQRGKKTVAFPGFPSLPMSRNLTGDHGAESLISSQVDFRAKTYPLRAKEKESPASGPGYGKNSRESLGKLDQGKFLLKTVQCSLIEDSPPSLVTLPKWGMVQNGELYRLPTLAHRTNANVSGFWATPTIMDTLPPKSLQALHQKATVARPGRTRPANLRDQVSNLHNWPTPTSNKLTLSGELINKDGTAWNGISKPHSKKTKKAVQTTLADAVRITSDGGRLNPIFVEWLMGWPIGWTDLKPLEMDKFQEWLQQHLIF